jgi:hypothetical protein
MANTHFSGPVNSTNGFVALATTGAAALLVDIADPLNTTWKYAGKQVVDLDDGIIYTAVGDAASDDWMGSDGTTSITPV